MNEATIVASNVQLTPEFAKRRRGDSQEEAKNNFKTDVFHIIIDSIQGVPYTMLPFRTAGISFVLKLESRYFHNMFHISCGFMC